ncbi:MAG: type II 3-dehydroquinate dehydratase [Oscillatoriales cyanobacterium]|nr:MAG: type II 3-dehydroquinate dehydratase [Oscillatoriales cyanobacterium]
MEFLKLLNILVLHGPNLNLLGQREPGVYGSATLNDINKLLEREAQALQVQVSIQQSNHEGVLVDAIHSMLGQHQGLLINAGAYTHTSVAIREIGQISGFGSESYRLGLQALVSYLIKN